MPPNQPSTETSAWEGGCLQREGSFTEGMGEEALTLHLKRRWFRGSQVEESVGGGYTCTLRLQLQELCWWKQNEQEEVVHHTAESGGACQIICCTNITEVNGHLDRCLEETYIGDPCRLETGYWVDGPLVRNHLGCSYIHTNLLKEMLPVSFATAGFTVVTHHPPHHLSLIKYLDSCRRTAQKGHKLIVYPNLIAMQSCATLDPDQVPGDN